MSLFSYLDNPTSLVLMIGIRVLIIFTILPIHEYAHAYAAKKMGDNTALISGRLTMNPLAHVDIVGAIFLLVFGFGWAKPVPINPRNFKNYKKGIAITAAAGPLSNILCAAIGIFVTQIIYGIPLRSEQAVIALSYVDIALSFFISINISLAVFNLIPVPPLDGSKILSSFASAKVNMFMYSHQQLIYIVFLVLLFTNVLQVPLGFLSNLIYKGLNYLFFWVEPLMKLIF